MKRIIIIGLILSGVLQAYFISCAVPERVYLRSFVTEYREPDKLILHKSNGDIHIIIDNAGFIGNYLSEGSEKSRYDRICEKHNDMSYNRRVTIADPPPPHSHIYADLASIEIVSDADWDDGHLAESSLNDITTFFAPSPKKYIDSGYKETYNWNDYTGEKYWSETSYPGEYPYGVTKDKSPYHPVTKMVSDLTSDDMMLLGGGSGRIIAILKFSILPTENKEHNITVTLTTDEGKTFSATINMVFE
jgi:hypothetical protein